MYLFDKNPAPQQMVEAGFDIARKLQKHDFHQFAFVNKLNLEAKNPRGCRLALKETWASYRETWASQNPFSLGTLFLLSDSLRLGASNYSYPTTICRLRIANSAVELAGLFNFNLLIKVPRKLKLSSSPAGQNCRGLQSVAVCAG